VTASDPSDPAAPAPAPAFAAGRLLLVGMMGAGKTTVGAELAAILGWRYVDSDAQVEDATGRTVPEIFAADGEQAFRRHESAALRAALGDPEPSVVSVAGGAVLDPANRAMLRAGGTVVWLRARVDTLAERVGDGAGRPLLGGDPAAALTHLSLEREPLYVEVADAIVDVDDLSPADVVDEVLGVVRDLPVGPASKERAR
jgi:shikimate kinase